jgi:DNA repair photolyase
VIAADAPVLVRLEDSDLYPLSTYRACEFRCTYCCTSAQGPSIPINNIVSRLQAALERIPLEAQICLGALIDAYPAVERRLGVTRAALEVLVRDQRSVRVITKGDTVLRDIDLLSSLPWHEVVVSLSTLDQRVLDQCDGSAPPATRRLEVLHVLAAAGLRVQCNIAPWIPGASDIEAIQAELPTSVRVLVAPPILGKWGVRTIAKRRLHREPVVVAYMDEYRRLGHLEGVDFLAPIPPPLENFAAHLPRRPAPISLTINAG